MISLKEFAEKLKGERSVAIISHVRPDGDTIGSSVGLCFALRSVGVSADLFCEDKVPEKYRFLAGTELYSDGDIKESYSAVIAVDVAEITRSGKYGLCFMQRKNTYNLDHHVSNTRFAKYNYVSGTAAAAEIVFGLIKELGVPVTEDIANALATGVITDTGNFRHKNVTLDTLKVATELFSYGADFNKIIYNTFNLQSRERAELFGKTMARIRYFHGGKTAMGIVRLSDLAETGAKQEDTEGFIDFIMGIRGVEIGVCVMETEKDKYKVSFRSHGADVNAVAGTFGGGGHTLAAGCKLSGDIEEVVDRLTFAVSRAIEE